MRILLFITMLSTFDLVAKEWGGPDMIYPIKYISKNGSQCLWGDEDFIIACQMPGSDCPSKIRCAEMAGLSNLKVMKLRKRKKLSSRKKR